MTATTTQSITFTNIVHRTRDCVGVTGGRIQHIDGPLQVKYWGSGPQLRWRLWRERDVIRRGDDAPD